MPQIEIKARENGPYLVPGSATYVDANGNQQTTPAIPLPCVAAGSCQTSHFVMVPIKKSAFRRQKSFCMSMWNKYAQ
jgi:hypothetical protein